MDNQQEKAGQDQRVSHEVDCIAAAISSAPIEELRAAIEEAPVRKKVNLEKLRDALDLLKECARLGHRESVETLIWLGSDIASFLSDIVQSAKWKESPSPSESSSKNKEQEGAWRGKIDESVDILLNLEVAEDEEEKHRFADLLARLPSARYSFPLSHLIGKSEPPEKPVREIADLCDCLIQSRLNTELAQAVHELSTQSLCWPLFVTVEDYQSKEPLAKCVQNLELGKAIASNIGVRPRGEDSPSALVPQLFLKLEQQRRVRRTTREIEDMRRSEESDEPASLDQLMREEVERIQRDERDNQKFEGLRRNGVFSDPHKLNPFIDEALKEFRRGLQKEGELEKVGRRDEQIDLTVVSSLIDENTRVILRGLREGRIWKELRESRTEEEIELLVLLISANTAPIGPTTRRGIWTLNNLWQRKAALLPPLQDSAGSIQQWTEAAYAYIASMYDGNLETRNWAPPIMDRILRKQGTSGGLKQFLREGFETLAGRDRKSR